MPLPAIITSERLRLRPATIDDADAVFEGWARDLEVARYLTWRPYDDITLVRAYLRSAADDWGRGTRFLWSIERRASGGIVGQISANAEGPRVNLGYVLARPWWGQGLMTEAVSALSDAALREAGIFRVWAVADVDNPASARVMEKAGMTYEGTLRRWIIHPNLGTEPRDVLCYAKVR